MNTGTCINFFGWSFITFAWLQVNHLFFDAIVNVINEHNEQIRPQTTVEMTVETTVETKVMRVTMRMKRNKE